MSVRTRLTLCFALALAAGLILFGFGIWFSMRSSLISDLNATLIDRAVSVEKFLNHELSERRRSRLHEELDEFSGGLPLGIWIEVLDSSNASIYRSPFPAGKQALKHTRIVKIRDVTYEIRVAGSLEGIDHTLLRLRILLLGLSPAVMLIAALGGFWLSRRALAPVDAITASARGISIDNLAQRLVVPQTGDELQRLSETWNGMLERLEAAVVRLSQFTADASHELRTPLAVIRATAELAAKKSRTPEAYRASLNDIVSETDRMTQLVEDLLFLARCDAGALEMPQSAVDLAQIARDACSALMPLAEEKSIRISTHLEPCSVCGNTAALRRLVVVLLDNAVKYSSPGSRVDLCVENACLIVRDHGIGISASDLPHIFERFYQADPARSNSGYGLGLTQAQSIIRRHGATAKVSSVAGEGSTFEVAFRRASVEATPELLPLR
jgi:heavy metal sensor kinase